jgi:hypothetical protein
MTIASITIPLKRALFFLAAVLFIVFGFAVDGASEVGHHAGFILGGIAIGMGLRR